jgi:hypothetical protein
MRALTFAGILHEDGRFELQPGFIVDGEPNQVDGELEVVVSGKGRPLAITRLILDTPCAYPSATPGEPMTVQVVAGLIAFPHGATQFSVFHEGKVILEQDVPEVHPEFKVDWPSPQSIGSGRQTISWVSSVEGCLATLGYSNDEGITWSPMSLPSVNRDIVVDMDALPGGDNCMFELIATDGFTTTRLRSETFAVTPKGWGLWILAPATDAFIHSGEVVSLAAQGYHFEERVPSFNDIYWSSSVDGGLGIGARVSATLSPGLHRITATMYDASSEVTVTIGE